MMKLLAPLSSMNILTTVAEESTSPERIGFIVLAIIIGPVIILTLAAVMGKPRTVMIPGLFLGSVVMFISAMVIGFAAIGIVLKFIIPQ